MKPLWRSLAGALLMLACAHGPAKAVQGTVCQSLVGPVSGVAFSISVTASLSALLSSNSGATAPHNDCSNQPVAGQIWFDTGGTNPRWRIFDGNGAWQTGAWLDPQNHIYLPPIGGGIATLAAAATTNLCDRPESTISINGGTTISSFGACTIGQIKIVLFQSVLALVHAPSSIILPGGANVTTQAGDQAVMSYAGGGVWRAVAYTRADGAALTSPAIPPVHYAGETILMRGPTCPANSVPENGGALVRANYPDLFAALGTRWGAGDGSTTFNLPNSGGRADRGWIAGQTIDAGRVFGTAQADQLGAHTHPFSVAVSGSGTYSASNGANRGVTTGNDAQVNQGVFNSTVGFTGSGSGTTSAAGGTETRMDNITAYHCIFLVNVP